MLKLIFIAPVDLNDKASGVTAKVVNQVNALRKLFEVFLVAFEGQDVVVYSAEQCISRNTDYTKKRLARLLDQSEFIAERKIEYMYIRYMCALPQLIWLLRKTKGTVKKAAIEIPDYPYMGKILKRKEYLLAVVDFTFRRFLHRYISRIFVCSGDKNIMHIPASRLVNGTDISKYELRDIDTIDNSINILSISTMGMATGVDRFIAGMGQYYRNGGQREIHLHVIGNGPSYNSYIEVLKNEGIESRVTMYGYMSADESKAIFDKCDIGLGAIAFHRVNIVSDSTLKSREYGLRGMPIIAENKIDIIEDDFKYIMYCPCSEDAVDMEKVVQFYDKCFNEKGKVYAANEIRQYFVDRCDVNRTMKPVIEYFHEDNT